MERNSYSTTTSTNVVSDPFDQSSFYTSSSIYLFSLGTIFSLSSTITRFLFPTTASSSYDEKLDDVNTHVKSILPKQPTTLLSTNSVRRNKNPDLDEDCWVEMSEVAAVMEKMGMPIEEEEEETAGEQFMINMSSRSSGVLRKEEFNRMFEEREPSLDEVKASFDVFDMNRDGFIDAHELQRVLCILGLRYGIEVETCRMMIRSAKEENRDDHDDRMSFNQFFKFMQNNFC